ncbi:MAG: hypothetical protein DYH15_14705 [Nitrosomonas sp. PRO4]|nr:hypothetical protein [Nitrosomonas sp. PRO4]
MNRYLNIKYAAIMRAFLLLMVVGFSGNAFAAKPDMATQAELDAAIAAQAAVDTGQNTTISALQQSITSLIAANAAQQAIIDNLIDKLLTPKKIGDFYGGGIVFYVDETGLHGLIASLSDQSNGIQWYNGAYKITDALGNSVGTGASNTTIIVDTQSSDDPSGNFAAKVAADFKVRNDGMTPCTGTENEICYEDWFLPSRQELELLHQKKEIVGGFADNYYWSSTEVSYLDAINIPFFDDLNGVTKDYGKERMLGVRAIRAF